jgi:hypothetical protein
MRQLIGVGTPRGLQGRLIAALASFIAYSAALSSSDGSWVTLAHAARISGVAAARPDATLISTAEWF